MLTFVLKKDWYEKILSGEKTKEYREVKPYWVKRLKKAVDEEVLNEFFESCRLGEEIHLFLGPVDCIFQLGYSKTRMSAKITNIKVVNGKDTDLRIDAPVFEIRFIDVKELT